MRFLCLRFLGLLTGLSTVALAADATAPATPPAEDCECGTSAEQQLGHPVVGTVESLPASAGRIVLKHGGVPGLLRPGASEFLIDATVRARLAAGDRIIAQASARDDGTWTLQAVRLLAAVK